MAKKLYVGVNGIARQVNNIYVGVNGVARKVIKGYVGVGGVARPFWTQEKISYYGTIDSLSRPGESTGATVGNYALFLGGATNSSLDVTATAYDLNLTKIAAPNSSYVGMGAGCGLSIGNYAVFGGGKNGNSFAYCDAYDASLTKVQSVPELGAPMMRAVSAKIDNLGFIGGGASYFDYTEDGTATVTVFNENLTRNSVGMSLERYNCGAASVGSKVLFAGGLPTTRPEQKTTRVDIFDSSLTRTTSDLSVSMGYVSGAGLTNYALFLSESGVNAFDSSMVQTIPSSPSVLPEKSTPLKLGTFAVFAGGGNTTGAGNTYNQVICYDDNLTLSNLPSLSEPKMYMGASAIGNYGIFSGGLNSPFIVSSTGIDTVEVYKI